MSVASLISVALLLALASTLPLRSTAAPSVAAAIAPHRTSTLNKLTPAQLKALHDLVNELRSNAEADEYDAGLMRHAGLSVRQDLDEDYEPVTLKKRNSELLNSLLGLPKNILRSGRK